jgi:hypothetical protein
MYTKNYVYKYTESANTYRIPSKVLRRERKKRRETERASEHARTHTASHIPHSTYHIASTGPSLLVSSLAETLNLFSV